MGTVTTCGAQNIDMINLLFLFLPLFFDFVLCVPPVHQELPRSWQDEWVLGLKDTSLNITSTTIQVGTDDLAVIETQTFLDNWSVITADGVKRCMFVMFLRNCIT